MKSLITENIPVKQMTGTEFCEALNTTVLHPLGAMSPPFAKTAWAGSKTLFTLAIIQNIAESGITQVSIP
jgi:hypothetical protein